MRANLLPICEKVKQLCAKGGYAGHRTGFPIRMRGPQWIVGSIVADAEIRSSKGGQRDRGPS